MTTRGAGLRLLLTVWTALAASRAVAAGLEQAGDRAGNSRVRARERELHERMRQLRTDHFAVSFEGPEQTSLSGRVLEVLETAYWKIGGTLSVLPNVPIPVVLYTSEQFRDITRSPPWAVGAYDGIIRIPMRGALDNPRELERVLSHEYTHALVRLLSPRPVPTWLNEGLAAALEADDLAWARERVRRAGKAIPLDALQRPFRSLTSEQAGLAYASSALAARRLIDEAGGVAVSNLLRDVGQGQEFVAAFAHRIQRSLAAFQVELDRDP
jgi:hypothetical protein